MKLTCHVVPTADRQMLFREANALYAWSVYDITVTAEAFRPYTYENAVLRLSYAGTVYATAVLAPVPGRRDARAGVLNMSNTAFTTLCNLLAVEAGTQATRFVKDFTASIVMQGDGASVVDSVTPVVVLPFTESGASQQGSGTAAPDADFDGSSARALQNGVITQRFEGVEGRLEDLEEGADEETQARQTLATAVANHTGAASIHVTAQDKEKWNGAVYVTAAQRAALAEMVANPLSADSSFDAQWQRINALAGLLSQIIGTGEEEEEEEEEE